MWFSIFSNSVITYVVISPQSVLNIHVLHIHYIVGCGLELAYNITEMNGGARQTSFILLTDGKDTRNEQKKAELFHKSKLNDFLIDTILLSDDADGLFFSKFAAFCC